MHQKKLEEIEVYVRFMPHGPYVLRGQPSRVVMATVRDRCFVESKIAEAFRGRCYRTRKIADGILAVFTRKDLQDAQEKVQEIIAAHQHAKRPASEPAGHSYCI